MMSDDHIPKFETIWQAGPEQVPPSEPSTACLIAAAPDLLAACKALLTCDPNNLHSERSREVRWAIRAAIAKAEGSKRDLSDALGGAPAPDTPPPNPEEQRCKAIAAALIVTEVALEKSRERVAKRIHRGIPPGDALDEHDLTILTDAEQRRRDREGT